MLGLREGVLNTPRERGGERIGHRQKNLTPLILSNLTPMCLQPLHITKCYQTHLSGLWLTYQPTHRLQCQLPGKPLPPFDYPRNLAGFVKIKFCQLRHNLTTIL